MRTKSVAGVLMALFLTAAATVASAQEVTQAEKDRALQYLETTKKGVLEATKGLSEAQWNFKPAPDRWSVAQVTEHIAAAEDFLRTLAKEKVMTAPAGEAGRDVSKTDEAVMAMVPARADKSLRLTGRIDQALCREPRDDGGFPQKHAGDARSRARKPHGQAGRV
jgi:hypothetical protein